MATSQAENTSHDSEDNCSPQESVNKSSQRIVKSYCLMDHMEISVTEAEKRATSALNIRDYYTVYLIETKTVSTDWHLPTRNLSLLWRRYTEFEQLRAYLEVTYLWAIIPPLPEKRPTYTWQNTPTDTFDPDFVDRRRAGLENFLHRIAAHPILSKDPLFLGFLQQEEGWRESIKETGYLQKAETKLRALSIGVRLRCTDPNFDDMKNYASSLQTNLTNLLKCRAKLATRLHGIHKLHTGYGRIFSEWSAIEKDMGDGLQKSGHFFDSIAAGVVTALEDEELIADQLKEYLYFANAIQDVCHRQEVAHYELDQAQENVRNKSSDRLKIQQGRYGLMSRLFGSVETDEVRDFKLNQLDARIEEGEAAVQERQISLQDFSQKALKDYENFQEKKVSDLKDTLAGYLILQIRMARKGLQTWTHIKECIESIP